MKKLLAILLALSLVFTFSGCGEPETLEEAVAQADKLVAKWNDKTTNLATYESIYREDALLYFVTTQSLTVEDETDSFKDSFAKSNAQFIYEGLYEIFKNFHDVKLAITVLDENDTVYYITIDGESVPLSAFY